MNDDFSNIGDDLNYLISIAEKYFNRDDISSNNTENDTAVILTAISNYAEMQTDRIETIDFTPVIDALNNLETSVIVQNNIDIQARIEDLKKDLDITVDVTPEINVESIQTRLAEIKDLIINVDPNISIPDISINADISINQDSLNIPTQSINVALNIIDDISTYLKPISVDVTPNVITINDLEPINVDVNPIISDIDISPINVDVNPILGTIDEIKPISVNVNPIIDETDISVNVKPIVSEIDISPISVSVTPKIDMSAFEIIENIKTDINFNINQENNEMVTLMNDNNKLLVDLITRIESLSSNINNSNINNTSNINSIINNNSSNNSNNTTTPVSNLMTSESSGGDNNSSNRVDYTDILNDISSSLSSLIKSNKTRRFTNDLDI